MTHIEDTLSAPEEIIRVSSHDLVWATAEELKVWLDANQITVAEIAEVMIARIQSVNPSLNAFVHFDPAEIRAQAAALDAKKALGKPLGPIFGLPYSIKMLTEMEGLDSSAGLLPLKGAVGKRDATVARRLREADGLFLGTTNAPETGYHGGSSTNHVYGQTQNPWKQGHTPGGSSGGAAVAVVSGLGVFAEGADGAGSVRIPASLCGAVGFKPSLGLIPLTLKSGRFYDFLFHGPITRTVADSALMLDVMAGQDESDPLSLPTKTGSWLNELDRPIDGWRIAYSPDLGTGAHVDPEVAAICAQAVKAFEELGATVTNVTVPWPSPEDAMWDGIWVPGYASHYDLLDWDQHVGEVDQQLIDILKEGKTLTALEIARADNFRGAMYDAFTELMHNFELLVSPTLASASFPLDQFAPDWLAEASLRTQLLGWLLTYPFNMLTVPAISVPAGFTSDGRPVGLQIAGRFRGDGDVLAAAAKFERLRPWAHAHPELPLA